ncbi:hypothetical protein Droror1_Dr00027843 [Drosera rotundifolia]
MVHHPIQQCHGRGRGDFYEIDFEAEMEDVYTKKSIPMPTFRQVPCNRGTIIMQEPTPREGISRRSSAPPAPLWRDSASQSAAGLTLDPDGDLWVRIKDPTMFQSDCNGDAKALNFDAWLNACDIGNFSNHVFAVELDTVQDLVW